jgi:hypothetical protein
MKKTMPRSRRTKRWVIGGLMVAIGGAGIAATLPANAATQPLTISVTAATARDAFHNAHVQCLQRGFVNGHFNSVAPNGNQFTVSLTCVGKQGNRGNGQNSQNKNGQNSQNKNGQNSQNQNGQNNQNKNGQNNQNKNGQNNQNKNGQNNQNKNGQNNQY